MKNIHEAWKANRNEIGDVYHHPTENGIVEKCIDLSCRKPLHAIGSEPNSDSSERWLEAYIIQLAKHSNNYREPFNLSGIENKYKFLASQMKFESYEDSPARPLDCLLYDVSTNHLIIMELKANRALRTAVKELNYYAGEVIKIKNGLVLVFDLNNVSAVEGYIVWPENENADNSKKEFGRWGLIEYSGKSGMIKNGNLVKPWEQFKIFGHKLTMKFSKIKNSEVIK